MNEQQLDEKAAEMGGFIGKGGQWKSDENLKFFGFSNREKAEAFERFLMENGISSSFVAGYGYRVYPQQGEIHGS